MYYVFDSFSLVFESCFYSYAENKIKSFIDEQSCDLWKLLTEVHSIWKHKYDCKTNHKYDCKIGMTVNNHSVNNLLQLIQLITANNC